MNRILSPRGRFFILGLFLGGLILGATSIKAEEWHYYASPTGIFSIRIHDTVKEDHVNFRVGPNILAQTGQAYSTIDQRPYRNVVKNYMVRYQQTLAPMNSAEIGLLMDRELSNFVEYYKGLDGNLRDIEEDYHVNGYPASSLYMTYQDPDLGEQSIKIVTVFTDTVKLNHILSGPEAIMNSFPSRKYMESLRINGGYKAEGGSVQQDWQSFTSPLGIFTAYLPEAISPYVPHDPEVKNSDTIERISTDFFDPVRQVPLQYNIYGYSLKENITFQNAEDVLRNKHILRFRFEDEKVRINRVKNKDNIPGLLSKFDIVPPDNLPNFTYMRLRLLFYKNYVFVQELLGPRTMVESEFAEQLLTSAVFHPPSEIGLTDPP